MFFPKLVSILCFSFSCGLFAAEETDYLTSAHVIRIATGEWSPYISTKLKNNGVISHIISEAFAKEGVKVIYTFFPWKRAFKQVMAGHWDASPSWAPTPERLEDFYFSDVVHIGRKIFFHLKKNNFEWSSFNDLEKYTIGATLGYTYGEEFDTAAEEGRITVVPVRSALLNFNMLFKGRVDIFPIEKEVGFAIINANYSEKSELFSFHSKPILETTYHLIFTKRNDKSKFWLKKFNTGLNKLRDSGEFSAMMKASIKGDYDFN